MEQMIILLHGDDIEASRAELNRLKTLAKGRDFRPLDGRALDISLLTQALESHSLFGGETLVIIENLFGKLGRKVKLIEELAAIINKSAGTEIIIWEDKELGTTVIKNFKSPQVKLFKLPVVIFQFLDGLKPSSAKYLLSLFQKLALAEPPELVFSMIVRRFRQLIMLRDNVIPEGLQGWQVGRLTTQAKSFNMDKLVSMYKKLPEIEFSSKTGTSAFNLTQQIELFLLSL